MDEGSLKQVAMGAAIPRVIHLTNSRRELPEALARNVQNMQAMNPGWTVRLYDDPDRQAYIRDHFGPAFLDAYRRIEGGYGPARADLFRYLALYNEGGCYIDIKSAMTRPLDSVLRAEDRYLLGQWDNGPGGRNPTAGLWPAVAHIPGGEYQQWHIVSVAGHPFLRAVILQVLNNITTYRPEVTGVGKMGVLHLTGPIPYSLAIEPIRTTYPHRLVDAEHDLGFLYSICSDRGNSNEHAKFFKVHYSSLTYPIVRGSLRRRCMWTVYRLGGRFSLWLQRLFGEQRVRALATRVKEVLHLRA